MTDPTTRRRWLRGGSMAAVALVPLAFAGLFVTAIASDDGGLEGIPAAIVNNDRLVTSTLQDGTEQPVLAGRQLVTELTGTDDAGFEWTISNTEDAEAALAAGEVYAVVTVPSDFSASIVSLSSSEPKRADLSIRTDDAHNYLTGSVAQVVGDGLVNAFGKEITAQYIAGIYSTVGGLGSALADSAEGAGSISEGAGDLSDGLTELADGAGSAESGANELANGLEQYVDGVGTLADGLRDFQAGIQTARGQLLPGLTGYTGGVSDLSAALTGAVAQLNANPADPVARQTVTYLTGQLATAAQGGSPLVAGVRTTFDSLASGAAQSAGGAQRIASSGGALVTGVDGLADGFDQLGDGAAQSSDGAAALADGAGDLASGLQGGADQVPSLETAEAEDAAEIAASPVGLTVTRDNEVSDVGQIIATLLVPLGLWIGALAVFLVLRPLTRRALGSTAASGRLVLSAVSRASVVTAVQALLLVALLHITLGVDWALLPLTLAFSLVMALSFTAFHYLLTIGFGRAGLVVSIFLLAIQVTSTGGLYPVQVLAAPFQFASPFLPLTHGVAGMQALIAGGNPGGVVLASFALVGFGLASVLLSLVVLRRVRRSRALGLVPARA